MYVRPSLFHVLRRAVVAAVALLSLTAHAFSPFNSATGFIVNASAGQASASLGPTAVGNFAKGTLGATANSVEWTFAKSLPFSPAPQALLKAEFSAANLAKAAVGPTVVIALAATALKYAFDAACVRVAGGTLQLAPGGLWEQCNMTTKEVYAAAGYYNTYTPAVTTDQPYCGFGSTVRWVDSYNFQCILNGSSIQGGYRSWVCPTGQNGSNISVGAINASNQNTPPDCHISSTQQDGWKPADVNADVIPKLTTEIQREIASDFSGNLQGGAGQAQKLLQAEIDNNMPLELNTIQAFVPPSTTGTPETSTTTQTNPDGTTTTTTETKTPKVSCTAPSGNQSADGSLTITCTTTWTTSDITATPTTSTNPDGTTATSTKTTTSNSTTTASTTPDQTDPCISHPERIGCSSYGSPDTAGTLSKVTQAIPAFSAVSFGGGTCPSPVSFAAFGRSYQFTYDAACAKLVYVRALLLALAAVAAAFIFADGFKVS